MSPMQSIQKAPGLLPTRNTIDTSSDAEASWGRPRRFDLKEELGVARTADSVRDAIGSSQRLRRRRQDQSTPSALADHAITFTSAILA